MKESSLSIWFGQKERIFPFEDRTKMQGVVDYLDSVFVATKKFFHVDDDRYKVSSVSRYRTSTRQSIQTWKWYITVVMRTREVTFYRDTEKGRDELLAYFDDMFKVQIV